MSASHRSRPKLALQYYHHYFYHSNNKTKQNEIRTILLTDQFPIFGEGDITLDDSRTLQRGRLVRFVGMFGKLHACPTMSDGEIGSGEGSLSFCAFLCVCVELVVVMVIIGDDDDNQT